MPTQPIPEAPRRDLFPPPTRAVPWVNTTRCGHRPEGGFCAREPGHAGGHVFVVVRAGGKP